MSSVSSCPVCGDGRTKKPLDQVRDMINLYQGKPGSLIQVLHLAQEIYGCLPLEVQELVAEGLGIPLSEVSGVVSFYSLFTTTPRGEHIIRVCLGTACYVRGGKRVVDQLKQKLSIDLGETTADGKFTLEVVRCIGACGLAPAMTIDGQVFKQVNPNKLDSILNKFEGRR